MRDSERVLVGGMTEFPLSGREYTVRSKGSGRVVAKGYVRVVFGDHGPYLECRRDHVVHHVWRVNREGRKGRYYDLWRSGSDQVEWYEQLRGVEGKPNPPQGRWSVSQNRLEGYADYKVGMWYASMDKVVVESVPSFLNGRGRV